jgi:hypothetical protein
MNDSNIRQPRFIFDAGGKKTAASRGCQPMDHMVACIQKELLASGRDMQEYPCMEKLAWQHGSAPDITKQGHNEPAGQYNTHGCVTCEACSAANDQRDKEGMGRGAPCS